MLDSLMVRKKFLVYFEKNGHKIIPSDSLIPSGDPTLLFTSAGMVQFKKHFLGQSSDTFSRASSCQKCFRTSDIERVGFTSRHLTFFEMLGNFSFGDYFKQEAIHWAWEFLTKDMALPQDRLYPTIYKSDNEAYDLWKLIVPESRIIRLGDDSNFWNMGPTGPCGPCSEILIDLGEDLGCGKSSCAPGCDCDRYLEIWNLVFTQFDRKEDGTLKNLPRKNIDTGMGLERITAVATGKKTIFDTDLFVPSIDMLADMLSIDKVKNASSLRMMVDHCRAITFLGADGIIPSNEGRGYIYRRLLRRALRKGKMFGIGEPFLYKVCSLIASPMKKAYPELLDRVETIAGIAKMEEEKFLETLESGMKILDELINKNGINKMLDGAQVFKLYDTYGFPYDLTKEIAQEQGLTIDERTFNQAQKNAQEKSRSAWSGSGEKDVSFYSTIAKETGKVIFEGYTKLSLKTTVNAIVKDGLKVDSLEFGQEGEIVLQSTPFYGESGGQMGDTGSITSDICQANVKNTVKPVDELYLHHVKIVKGSLKVGDNVLVSVNQDRRDAIMRHHTATHLLHKALRQVLGNHVTQAGSLVGSEYLRFDFTHPEALKKSDIAVCEDIVNAAIKSNMSVNINEMNLADARKTGAMALFGEKYSEMVRVISVGEEKNVFSIELCGGTHVSRTGDIGLFKIISESSVASGLRRIEAIAGTVAERYVVSMEQLIEELSVKLKSSKSELFVKVDKMTSNIRELEMELSSLKSKAASSSAADFVKNAKEIKGIKVVVAELNDIDNATLKDFSDTLKNMLSSGIIFVISTYQDKVSFIVAVTSDLVNKGIFAGKIAKSFALLIKGSGGGKHEFAQGGGKDPILVEPALKQLDMII